LILAEHLWSRNSGCENTEAAGSAFQQWWQWVNSASADCYEHSMQALAHGCQKRVTNTGGYDEN